MATIFLGGHLLQPMAAWAGVPDFFGHLFLVKSEDSVVDKDDLIIRGGPAVGVAGDPLTLQNNITYGSSLDYPKAEDWTSVDNASQYWGYTPLQFAPGASVEGIWRTLVDLASQIANHIFDYELLVQNSNSLIATLLKAIGVETVPNPGGLSYAYPGFWHALTSDLAGYGGNYTYVVKGNDRIGETPVDDRLCALDTESWQSGQAGDHVVGFAGDDIISDGNRMDVLEGGEGDDRIHLSADGTKDIVIVGQGNDVISGGGPEDRLVIRATDIYIPDGAPGFGSAAGTTGVPLLGGFRTPDSPYAGFRPSIDKLVRQGLGCGQWGEEPVEAGPSLWRKCRTMPSISTTSTAPNATISCTESMPGTTWRRPTTT